MPFACELAGVIYDKRAYKISHTLKLAPVLDTDYSDYISRYDYLRNIQLHVYNLQELEIGCVHLLRKGKLRPVLRA
jgi:hypothetical protein